MSEPKTKDRVIAVRQLPDDATVEEAMERLHLLARIERGLKEEEQGSLVTNEEVRSWLRTL